MNSELSQSIFDNNKQSSYVVFKAYPYFVISNNLPIYFFNFNPFAYFKI